MNERPIIDPVTADDTETGRFLASVGDRVRTARAERGLSRKALAELSGVSQRYLAQLEAGDGNISVALLRRVAGALEQPTAWFLGAESAPTGEAGRLVALWRAAGPEQRRKAFEALSAGAAGKAARIALIGLRGAGKSTLGRLAAERLGVPFLELNEEIERESGMAVNELIALYGQEGYRRLERQSVERVVAAHERVVIAAAGGVVSEAETFDHLLAHCHTIWLKASPEEHMGRVRAQGDTRPMAGNPAAMEELKSILTSREALYAKADFVVDTSGRTRDQSLADVLAVVTPLVG